MNSMQKPTIGTQNVGLDVGLAELIKAIALEIEKMLITLNQRDLMRPRRKPVLAVITKRYARVMIHLLIVLHVILVCSHLHQTTPTFCSQIHHTMHIETIVLLQKLNS